MLYTVCMFLCLLLQLISMLSIVLLTVVILVDCIAVGSHLSKIGLGLAVVNGNALSKSYVIALVAAVLRPTISASCLLLRLLGLERYLLLPLLSLEQRRISLLKGGRPICEVSLDRRLVIDLLKELAKRRCQGRGRYVSIEVHIQLVPNNCELIVDRGEICYAGIVKYLLDL